MARYLTRYPESEYMAKKRAAAAASSGNASTMPTNTRAKSVAATYDLDSFGMTV
jgi:hypothetical protein